MEETPFWVWLIGLSAQLIFAVRVVIQWIQSEKSHKVESPDMFWVLSIAGATVLFIYGSLRHDFSIIFGELLAYYIYVWNLRIKGFFTKIPKTAAAVIYLIPVITVIILFRDLPHFVREFMHSDSIAPWLLALGVIGQTVYKMRFAYQIWYSARHHESSLPLFFWVLAVAGGVLIIIYGIFRGDWVLVLGQAGIIAALRNIVIALRARQ